METIKNCYQNLFTIKHKIIKKKYSIVVELIISNYLFNFLKMKKNFPRIHLRRFSILHNKPKQNKQESKQNQQIINNKVTAQTQKEPSARKTNGAGRKSHRPTASSTLIQPSPLQRPDSLTVTNPNNFRRRTPMDNTHGVQARRQPLCT